MEKIKFRKNKFQIATMLLYTAFCAMVIFAVHFFNDYLIKEFTKITSGNPGGSDILAKLKVLIQNSEFTLVLALIAFFVAVSFIILYSFGLYNALEGKLFRLAYYDNITDIPNRQHLMEYLKNTAKIQNKKYALLFVDIDNFKLVNDHLGHVTGDALLKDIGAFFSGWCSKNSSKLSSEQNMFVSRFGGDEFVLILPGADTADDVLKLCEDLIRDFGELIVSDRIRPYNIGLSIGASIYLLHSTDYSELLKYSDIAMYTAKKSGKNQTRVYNNSMHISSV